MNLLAARFELYRDTVWGRYKQLTPALAGQMYLFGVGSAVTNRDLPGLEQQLASTRARSDWLIGLTCLPAILWSAGINTTQDCSLIK